MYSSPSESCWSSFDIFPVDGSLVDGIYGYDIMPEDIALRVDVLTDAGFAHPSDDNPYSVQDAVPKSLTGTKRKSCIQCGNQNTPQWRQGPNGPRSLCNACGVAFMKGGFDALKNRSTPLCRRRRT